MSRDLRSQAAPELSGVTGGVSNEDHDTKLLIDAKAAARLLSIGGRKLWSLTKCDAVPSQRIGRAVRYCPAELRAWIAAGCPTEPGAAHRVRKGVRS